MIANGKIQITIHNGYIGQDILRSEDLDIADDMHVLVADAVVRTVDHPDLSLLELQIFVPSHNAAEVLVGMVEGGTQIEIGKITPMLEPD